MPRGMVFALVSTALLMLSQPAARAQTPHIGLVTCEACGAAADLPAAALFGFRQGSATAVSQPDVLFDATRVGGSQVGGLAAPAVGSPLWSMPPNWRNPPSLSDDVAALVINEGTLHFDSSDFIDQDMGLNAMQPLCSYPGAMAPRVSAAGADKIVEWSPIVELNTDVIANDCTLGGAVVRGLIIGYDIYRLPASALPAPPRREFVVSGYLDHADLSALDFTVPDPDGMSGSDLDSRDGLSLRNPDGLPDTGDELLVFTDAGAGAADSWYRVQPVVAGSQAFYETGLTGSARVPAARVDLDGDGTPDSVDIGRDGFMEFIDPSGRGLGLTWAGEIASSLEAGRGIPDDAVPGCDGLPPPPVESDCGNAADDDGDTLVDCLDETDCCGSAGCLAEPLEITRLDVAKATPSSVEARVSWLPVAPQAPGAKHDVVTGCLCRLSSSPEPRAPGCLWQDRGFVAIACHADDIDPLAISDARPVEPGTFGFYYLVREQSACGVAGSYGSDSRGLARIMGAADCLP